jgi:hypothetical protein
MHSGTFHAIVTLCQPTRREPRSSDPFALRRLACGISTSSTPRPVDPAEVADALWYDGNRRIHHADDAMARIPAERLIRHLERAGLS